MQISPLVEIVPPRHECGLHQWEVHSTGDDVEEETYTCLRCGATWCRTVDYRQNGRARRLELQIPDWPTWAEIIAEP